MEYYRNMQNDEIVYKEEAEEYALDKLGVKIAPKGKNGEITLEQAEFIETATEWFFSDNWIIEEEQEEEPSIFELINKECELENARCQV